MIMLQKCCNVCIILILNVSRARKAAFSVIQDWHFSRPVVERMDPLQTPIEHNTKIQIARFTSSEYRLRMATQRAWIPRSISGYHGQLGPNRLSVELPGSGPASTLFLVRGRKLGWSEFNGRGAETTNLAYLVTA